MNIKLAVANILTKALYALASACLILVVGCVDEPAALTADELIEQVSIANVSDADAQAVLVDLELDAADVTSKEGTTAVLDKNKDKIANKEKEVEDGLKALREDLGDANDVVKLVDACFQVSKNLKASAENSVKTGSKDIVALKNAAGRDTAPWEDCSASIAQKEAELQKQIDTLEKEKQDLNKKLAGKRKEFQEETDPAKKQILLKDITDIENERDEKQREIDRKEKQKQQLKILKMFMGLILVAIGAYLGGLDGGLLIGAGIGMITSSAAGDDGSSSSEDTTSPSAKDSDTPQEPVDSDARSNPAEAVAYQQSPQYTVIPVDENSNTAIDGYYLVRRKSDGNYDLLHTSKSEFVRRIEVDKIKTVGGVVALPNPFDISEMRAVSFRSNTDELVKIAITFKTNVDTELTLYQENQNNKVVWLLTDATVQ